MVDEQWRPALPDTVSPQLATLIQDCWLQEPRQRPTMAQVIRRLEEMEGWSKDGSVEREAEESRAAYALKLAYSTSLQKLGGTLRLEVKSSKEAVVVGPRGVSLGRIPACQVRLTQSSVTSLNLG